MKIAMKRAAAIAAFESAGPESDWAAIASLLASVMPKPKAKPDAVRWCDYTPAQMRGKSIGFSTERIAVTFADGKTIEAGALHKKGLPLPNVARAVRMAVRYYRAKRESALRRLADINRCEKLTACEASMEVPEIAHISGGYDVAQANAATAAMRYGLPVWGMIVDLAALWGGNWADAVKAMVYLGSSEVARLTILSEATGISDPGAAMLRLDASRNRNRLIKGTYASHAALAA